MLTYLNTYGLRNGRVISVDDLNVDTEYGLRCNCVCPCCGDPLVARIRGRKKEKHFAHASGSDCEKGYESAVHILAKDVIEEGALIRLPSAVSSFGSSGYFVIDDVIRFQAQISESKVIRPDENKVFVEKDLGAIRPDVMIESGDIPLIIEILVTHAVDEEKRKRIKDLDISCIEIDFSYYKHTEIGKEEIRNALEGKDPNIRVSWVYNRKIEKQDSEIEANKANCLVLQSSNTTIKKGMDLSDLGYKHEVVYERTVRNCPCRKMFDPNGFSAKFDDCINCPWNCGTLKRFDSDLTDYIVCSKGDNNVEIRAEDVCTWLIIKSRSCLVPATEERCRHFIETLVNLFKDLSSNEEVINAKARATKILLARFYEES